MSKDGKIASAVLTGIVVAAISAICLVLEVSTWLWIVLCLIPIVIAGIVAYRINAKAYRILDRKRPIFTEEPAPPPEPPAPGKELLSGVCIPSCVPDYRFLLSGSVYWRRTGDYFGIRHENVGALARESVIGRAEALLANERPENHGLLTERLNASLGHVVRDRSGQVEAWATEISVELPQSDKGTLERLAKVRKAKDVWEHERNYERNVREYLADDVLKTPGSAVVWWLSRNNEDEAGLHNTINNIGNLQKLTSAAHVNQVPKYEEVSIVREGSQEGDSLALFDSAGASSFGHDDYAKNGSVIRGEVATRGPEKPDELIRAGLDAIAENKDKAEMTLLVEQVALLFNQHGESSVVDTIRRHFQLDLLESNKSGSESSEE